MDFYADAFKRARSKAGDGELAGMIMQQIGRDLRTAQIQGAIGISGSSNGDVPATPKQLAYLDRLGVPFEERISKQQASELIDEAVAAA